MRIREGNVTCGTADAFGKAKRGYVTKGSPRGEGQELPATRKENSQTKNENLSLCTAAKGKVTG